MENSRVNRNGRSYGVQNAFIAVIIAFLFIVINLFSAVAFSFGVFEVLVLGIVSVVIYAFLLWFLVSYSGRRPKGAVDVKKSEVFAGRPSENPVSMYIPSEEGERLAEDIMNELNMPAEKIEIPHYDYVGSSQTRTYHLKDCNLAKKIPAKFKLMNNGDLFFKKRKFKRCKICLKKKAKKG
jgi:ABC-type multidrug transport system fused ATPase/permease subunit